VRFERATYDLAEFEGGPLFEPDAMGLEPAPISTACWRGFVATYSVTRNRLILKELEVGMPAVGDA
jgi:hypothetical protein